ncbi:MAG: hypothetical protein H6Q86_4843 [candidate division NC10 bacterium]|nr:hypothetical protein [candidate division NC10 bacterium]
MMNTKLTLRLNRELIRRAKAHSRRTGKSVSALVGDFFSLLSEHQPAADSAPTPRVRSLIGVLKNARVTEQDYRKHLAEKHQ